MSASIIVGRIRRSSAPRWLVVIRPSLVSKPSGFGTQVATDVTELGRKGGRARVENLNEAELSKIGQKGAGTRWKQYCRDHPEKLKERQEREARKTGKVGRPPKPKAAKGKKQTAWRRRCLHVGHESPRQRE